MIRLNQRICLLCSKQPHWVELPQGLLMAWPYIQRLSFSRANASQSMFSSVLERSPEQQVCLESARYACCTPVFLVPGGPC